MKRVECHISVMKSPVGPVIQRITKPDKDKKYSTGRCGNISVACVVFDNEYRRHYCRKHADSVEKRYGIKIYTSKLK